MAIGVTVGLLALLGAGFGALTLGKGSASESLFSRDSAVDDASLYREIYEIKTENQESVVPPISSSEASRPADSSSDNNNNQFGRKSRIRALLAGMGIGGVATVQTVGKKPFNWGLFLGILGGAYVSYKVLSK